MARTCHYLTLRQSQGTTKIRGGATGGASRKVGGVDVSGDDATTMNSESDDKLLLIDCSCLSAFGAEVALNGTLLICTNNNCCCASVILPLSS